MRPVGPWLAVFLTACFLTVPALARGKATTAAKPAAAKVAKKTGSAKPTAAKKTAKAKPTKTAKASKTLALSIGYPNDGKLEGARAFRPTRHMKMLPDYAKSDAKWALPELLDALDRAAATVAKRYPGSVLGVGEMSAKQGGPIPRHRSHQTGRDVDVGFYLVSGKDRPMRPIRLVNMKSDGTSTVRSTTRFDEKRNWAFIAALLQDKKVKVTNIFVWSPLRARLLAHAEKIGAPRSLRQRAAQVMSQPANVQRHADHFHIRIACPDRLAGKGCIDGARPRPAAPTVVAERNKPATQNLPDLPMLGDDDEDFEPAAEPTEPPPAKAREEKNGEVERGEPAEREKPADPPKESPSAQELEAAAKPKAPAPKTDEAEKPARTPAEPETAPAPSSDVVTG